MNADGLKRSSTWAEIVQDWREGVRFNQDQWSRYEANEVTLANGKRLDSYTRALFIVSRKNSQLADLEPATAVAYLRELNTKYPPGAIIADTKRAQALFPHLIGERLRGRLILEVPVQSRPVPDGVLKAAEKLLIEIRDIDGHLYH